MAKLSSGNSLRNARGMDRCYFDQMLVSRTAFRGTLALVTASLLATVGCNDTGDVAAAVTLTLYSVDGVAVPVRLRTAGGSFVTLSTGRLQGTNWGHACGFAAGLAEGPLTTVGVSACRLVPGEERSFDLIFNDARFPSGSHTYRFIPD
jgi:hypothetical protein